MATTSREYWKQRTLKSEAYANGLAEAEIIRQQKYYKAAYKQLKSSIDALYIQAADLGENLTRTQLWQLSKYIELEAQLTGVMDGMTGHQISSTEHTLIQIFEQTTKTTLDALQTNGGLGINYRFNLIPETHIKQYINTAWKKESFSRIYERNGINIARRIKQDIGEMVLNGKTPSSIKLALQDDLNLSYRAADRLVRTEASHFYNDAAKKSYQAAGVQKVEFIAEHDDRLCEDCESYAASEGGVYYINTEPSLPAHPNCRCCYAPVVEPEATLEEANEIFKQYI